MTGSPTVHVIATGMTNELSVRAGLERCGATAVFTDRAVTVRDAEFVVLPGVGSFAAGMRGLRANSLDAAVRARVQADRPLLAVCLGMQLLGVGSDESPGVEGIGAFGHRAERFDAATTGCLVPQLGWNEVQAVDGARYLGAADWFYFANSYRVGTAPEGCRAACADYGGSFVAAFERGTTLACQFHPELSSRAGQELLTRWLAGGGS